MGITKQHVLPFKISTVMIAGILLIISFSAKASVKPNSLFSDHMVLQRGVTVPVWGTAAEGEEVTVQFNDQKVSTVAKDGKWMVKLNALKVGGPYTMSISGENIVLINDVLVGDVWICSGQSNMEKPLGPHPRQQNVTNWEKERDASNYPQIREYFVPHKYSAEPLEDAGSKWDVCSPATVTQFSAVGYFFAMNLHKQLSVPIGILFTSVGGTAAELWTSKAVLEKNTELQSLVELYDKRVQEYPAKLEEYKQNMPSLLARFSADSLKAVNEKRPLPRRPAPPQDAVKMYPGNLYNSMICPLEPYAVKGVAWYQGEANNSKAKEYQTLLPVMIGNWRNDWKNETMPFLIVQIAPYKDIKPELREAQLLVSQKTKNTALIVITDCGDSSDIHPPFKQPVGHRLALAARAIAYGDKLEYSGPQYRSMKVSGNKATLSFTHTGRGLVAKNGELKGFTVAGADKQFLPAKAEIKSDKVIVYSDGVTTPVAVRFGWANVPNVNFFNAEGLPASPFRTDVE